MANVACLEEGWGLGAGGWWLAAGGLSLVAGGGWQPAWDWRALGRPVYFLAIFAFCGH